MKILLIAMLTVGPIAAHAEDAICPLRRDPGTGRYERTPQTKLSDQATLACSRSCAQDYRGKFARVPRQACLLSVFEDADSAEAKAADDEASDLRKPGDNQGKNSIVVASDVKRIATSVDLGDEAASFGYTRNEGESASNIQFASALRMPSSRGDRVWLGGVAVDRDTQSDKRNDVRQVFVGLIADPFHGGENTAETGVRFSVLGAARRDFVKSDKSSIGALQMNVIDRRWIGGTAGGTSHHLFIPSVGVARVNARDPGDVFAASRTFAYAGFSETFYPPLFVLKQFSATLSGQISRDVSVGSGFGLTTAKFLKVGLNYKVPVPEDLGVVPVLKIERQVGSDFVDGVSRRNRTTIGLGLKIDSRF